MSYSRGSTVRTSITSGGSLSGGLVLLDEGPVVPQKSYNVFRGMSPTTANRIENRIKELEDALESEREIHLRSERELAEANAQLLSMNERVDEAENQLIVEVDSSRKKDQELAKVRKDFELFRLQHETELGNYKRRQQELLNELNEQLEKLSKSKSKSEKDKQQITIEIEALNVTLDNVTKAKNHAESKLEAVEDQLRKLKSQLDEVNRVVSELRSDKDRLAHENADLQKQLKDIELNSATYSKSRSQLQIQLDDAKSQLDEQTRNLHQLEIQYGNLQLDYDKVLGQLEEESEAANSLRAQNQKLQGDLAHLKGRYEKDILAKSDELEDYKRKLNARITELETFLEQANNKASKLDKDKNKLTIDIREITLQLDEANALANESLKGLKHTEQQAMEWQKKFEDVSLEYNANRSDGERNGREIARLKALVDEQQSKIDHLTREISKLNDALKEAELSNRDLSRSLQDATSIKVTLQNERDGLLTELSEARETIRELENKLDSINAQFTSLKLDLESKLRQRDEELEAQRRNGQRSAGELQKTIIELETRYKGEHGRLKKKHENEQNELYLQIESLNFGNGELAKNNKSLSIRIKELEQELDRERLAGQNAKDAVNVLERKMIVLNTEINDLKALLDAAERARKLAENDLAESTSNSQNIHITINNLTNEKRRIEADYQTLQRDYDDSQTARRIAEDKLDSLNHEISRLNESLRQERERGNFAETARKQLEVQIHELTIQLENSDLSKEGRRAIEKLKNKVQELESELDLEQRRGRDYLAEIRKFQKQSQDYKIQFEDCHRINGELQDQNSILIGKLNTLKKQIEEQDEVLSITMGKYRKVQQQLEEAERRADRAAESNATAIRQQHTLLPTFRLGSINAPGTFRSVSVARNLKY